MASGIYAKLIIRATIVGGIAFAAGCEGQSMDQIFGVGDANPPTDQISPSPTPKPTPTPTPPPTPAPTPANTVLKKNMQFDAVRSKGMAEVYQLELDPAVATFNSAYRIKPNDKSVGLWLDAIKNAQTKAAERARQMNGGTPAFQNPPGTAGAPGAPAVPGAPPSLNPQLLNAAKGPGAAPPPSQSQVDPRLVF